MAEKIQTLKGFRDFYPEDCAVRNYVFDTWRAVAHRYGFVEYEGPVLESADLYRKKSGDEILGQLFHFEDRGEREVAMRPELTPTLARMATARQRDYKKPLRWFGIGQFFRYETPQKGRTREFYQFNVDILGEASRAADAELVAFSIDLMRDLGFTADDFTIRLSDRDAWTAFLEEQNLPAESTATFLQIIDKMEREKPAATAAKLAELGTSREAVDAFIASADDSGHFAPLLDNLAARGMSDFVKVDLGVVRGLAYYTGTVFEVFDQGKGMRAVAGGGRYDKLCGLISDGSAEMPACGFAMGDVVITDLIRETKSANALLDNYLAKAGAADIYVVIADETQRAAALAVVQTLRAAGYRVDYPLTSAKVGKQFGQAEHLRAKLAVVIGSEHPTITVKSLASREQEEGDIADLLQIVQKRTASD